MGFYSQASQAMEIVVCALVTVQERIITKLVSELMLIGPIAVLFGYVVESLFVTCVLQLNLHARGYKHPLLH